MSATVSMDSTGDAPNALGLQGSLRRDPHGRLVYTDAQGQQHLGVQAGPMVHPLQFMAVGPHQRKTIRGRCNREGAISVREVGFRD
ncbi:MAG: hypothetical protein ACKOFK_00295, partial [Betaproteobacteria bacterium]